MRAVCSVVCSDPSLSFYLTQQVPVQLLMLLELLL